ncbi:MAG: GCN5-related N-acetyltransferase [Myxococcaceae bacterium]|nr:GCN5-related N-acetyltransferase [Myxococcaceae bacterium]
MNAATIVPAERADLPQILALQKVCFLREAERVGDFTIAPLVQTLDEIAQEFTLRLFLKAQGSGPIVGTVRADCDEAGTCRIGRLCVQPALRGQGLGTSLMHAIEARFVNAAQFEIFTGRTSEDVIRLYEQLGYERVKREAGHHEWLVYLRKRRSLHMSG